MFTAILWDYDGTLANTPVKNIAVTRAVLGRRTRPCWTPCRRP